MIGTRIVDANLITLMCMPSCPGAESFMDLIIEIISSGDVSKGV